MVRKFPLALVFVAFAVTQQALSVPRNGTPIPVFAPVSSEHGNGVIIDPILLLSAGKIHPVPNPCDNGRTQTAFDDKYLKSGTHFAVVFGGGETGSVTVGRPDPNFGETIVAVQSGVRIEGLTMALAVGSSGVARKTGLRRNPTADERNLTRQLAEMIFTDKGVKSSAFARMRFGQLTVTKLDFGVPEIVASVEIERPDKLGMEYSLFFTAKPSSKDASVIWYQHSLSETEAEAVYIVDVIDTDRDGANELIARHVFYENYRYEVYKQRNGHWEQAFKTEVFGCL